MEKKQLVVFSQSQKVPFIVISQKTKKFFLLHLQVVDNICQRYCICDQFFPYLLFLHLQ